MPRTQRKPPSRVKYEAANPTITARLPRAAFDRVKEHQAKTGESIADLVMATLDQREIPVKQIEESAYKQGYAAAQEHFQVPYPCRRCRRPILVNSPEEKQAVSDFMQQRGWKHVTCPTS